MLLLLLVLASSLSTLSAQSITSVLASNAQLSSLLDHVKNLPNFSAYLDGLTDVTFLAPSNDALTSFFSGATGTAASQDQALLQAILTYHVQDGTWYEPANSPGPAMPHFIRTMLTSPEYTNVTNGQYVEGVRDVTGAGLLYSGLGDTSKIITAVGFGAKLDCYCRLNSKTETELEHHQRARPCDRHSPNTTTRYFDNGCDHRPDGVHRSAHCG